MDIVAQVRLLIAEALALLGGIPEGSVTRFDDPMTAVLGPDGVWTPSWLKNGNDRIRARYPDLYLPLPGIGFDGKPRRTAIQLMSGFYLPACLARTDLTDLQRETINKWDQFTFFAAATGDPNNVICGINTTPEDNIHLGLTTPFEFISALHRSHTNFEALPRVWEQTYKSYGVVL